MDNGVGFGVGSSICSGSANRLLGVRFGSVLSRRFDIGFLLGVGEKTLAGSGGGVVMRRMNVGGRSLGRVVKVVGGSEGVLFFLGAVQSVPRGGKSVSRSMGNSSATQS